MLIPSEFRMAPKLLSVDWLMWVDWTISTALHTSPWLLTNYFDSAFEKCLQFYYFQLWPVYFDLMLSQIKLGVPVVICLSSFAVSGSTSYLTNQVISVIEQLNATCKKCTSIQIFRLYSRDKNNQLEYPLKTPAIKACAFSEWLLWENTTVSPPIHVEGTCMHITDGFWQSWSICTFFFCQ